MTTKTKTENRVADVNGEATPEATTLTPQECNVLSEYCDLAIRQGGKQTAPIALHLIGKLEAMIREQQPIG